MAIAVAVVATVVFTAGRGPRARDLDRGRLRPRAPGRLPRRDVRPQAVGRVREHRERRRLARAARSATEDGTADRRRELRQAAAATELDGRSPSERAVDGTIGGRDFEAALDARPAAAGPAAARPRTRSPASTSSSRARPASAPASRSRARAPTSSCSAASTVLGDGPYEDGALTGEVECAEVGPPAIEGTAADRDHHPHGRRGEADRREAARVRAAASPRSSSPSRS